MSLPVADLGYVAALIDALAALRARTVPDSGTEVPVVQISGKHAVLPWLGEITGTRVVETRRAYTKHNCTTHCPDRHADITSVSYRWSVTGMKATIVLAAVEPYLRAQAADARRLIDLGLGVHYQGQTVNDMAARGWPIPDLTPHSRARVPLAVAQ